MKELAIFKATSGLAQNSHIKTFTPSLKNSSAELKELGIFYIRFEKYIGLGKKAIIENFTSILNIYNDPQAKSEPFTINGNNITLNSKSSTYFLL